MKPLFNRNSAAENRDNLKLQLSEKKTMFLKFFPEFLKTSPPARPSPSLLKMRTSEAKITVTWLKPFALRMRIIPTKQSTATATTGEAGAGQPARPPPREPPAPLPKYC